MRRIEGQVATAGEVDSAIPVGYGSISRVFEGLQNNVNNYGSVKGPQSLFGTDKQQADADTACLQFVRASDAVAEAPYTFNFRYMSLSASGDLLFSLDADPATVPKENLSLLSMPKDGNSSGFFNWLERRQMFTFGDVLQQATANTSRFSLEQAGSTWQYKLVAPAATDHPFYVAKVEGRPPMVFFVKP